MAKQKGAIKLSGNIGDITFTAGKSGALAKRKSKFTKKQKQAAAGLPQTTRTKILNAYAGQLFRALKQYHGKPDSRFWQNILSCFRKEKSNHRVLLLQQLHGLEEHCDRPFTELCQIPFTAVSYSAKHHTVKADISVPAIPNGEVHCYKIQFILTVWNKRDELRHLSEESPWLDFDDTGPKFTTIQFARTDEDTEWVLVCRVIEGFRFNTGVQAQVSRMRILESGTVCDESKKILFQRSAQIEAEKNAKREMPGTDEGKVFEIRGEW